MPYDKFGTMRSGDRAFLSCKADGARRLLVRKVGRRNVGGGDGGHFPAAERLHVHSSGTFRNVPLLLSHACLCAGRFDAYILQRGVRSYTKNAFAASPYFIMERTKATSFSSSALDLLATYDSML